MNQYQKAARFFLSIFFLAVVALLPRETAMQANAADDLVDVELFGTYGQTEARAMLERINEFRHSEDAWYWNEDDTTKTVCSDLQDLTYDYELELIAMQRAAEIALVFAHTRPNGTDYATLQRGQSAVGENIAAGHKTEETVFKAWREDDDVYQYQGHRRNMLSSALTHIGIGHFEYGGIHFWVQEFGNPGYGADETEALDESVSITIPMKSSYISQMGIVLSGSAFSVKCGNTCEFPAIVPWISSNVGSVYVNSTMPVYNTDISITSSDENVAKITDGKIEGISDGTATFTVTASLGDITATTRFTVEVYTYLYLENAKMKLSISANQYTGEAYHPTVIVTYGDVTLTEGTDFTVTYDDDMINCECVKLFL